MLQCLLLSLMECLVAISVWECSGFSLQPVSTAVGWDGMCVLAWGCSCCPQALLLPSLAFIPECSWKGQARQGSCSSALLFRTETMLWDFPTKIPTVQHFLCIVSQLICLLIHVQMQELFSYFQCCILKYPERNVRKSAENKNCIDLL